MSGVAESAGMSNTAMLALAGSMGGKYGAALGAVIGLTMDFAATNDSLTDSLKAADDALDRAFGSKAGTTDMAALEATVEDARQKYIELVDEVEAGGITGLKFRVDSAFGDNDVEEAYATLMRLSEDLGDVQEREARASRERAADKSYYNSIQAETEVLEANIAAMQAKREEAMIGINAELDYQEALLDVGKAAKEYAGVLKDNGQLMPGLRREGIEAKRELTNLASAWNGPVREGPGEVHRPRDQHGHEPPGRQAPRRRADEHSHGDRPHGRHRLGNRAGAPQGAQAAAQVDH
jgi:hypothetical protein